MAEGPPGPSQSVEIDADFEPLSRPRSCTWPLPRPEQLEPGSSSTSSPGPPLQEPAGSGDYISNLALLEEDYDEYTEQTSPALSSEYQDTRIQQQQQQQRRLSGCTPHVQPPQQVLVPAPLGASSGISQRKSSSSRRNAWGNMSYADLITKAIETSPEKRLTLSQIYDWMVKSVPYFNDKGDSNSSAGWKNSIRHNLSLHSRFVRIQNEGTGKSSWWMLNPEGGKSGKSQRRRAASMDNNSKFTKSRGRATKKKMTGTDLVDSTSHSPSPQYSHWLGSPHSQSTEDLDSWSTFRSRTSSDASTLSSRRSPLPSEQDEVGDPDMHMAYSVGPKLTATLPKLSKVTGSVAQRGSEKVMENLLDNLNLLTPQNSQMVSDTVHTSNGTMHQNSPFTSSHHKSMYTQVKMSPLLPVSMQANKGSFGVYQNTYNNFPAKAILGSDGEGSLRTGCLLPSYNSQNPPNPRALVKMPIPQFYQSPVPSRVLNTCNMIPLTYLTSRQEAPPQLSHTTHSHNFMASSSTNNGYTELTRVHPRGHQQERLPSDLDNMSIERFECDLESVLHETLMDGGALDFNFEPAGAQGFPPRGKNTSHSWVSSG